MEDDDLQTAIKAYGLASHAGDQEAMSELHQTILGHYQKQAESAQPAQDMSAGERFNAGVGHGIKRFVTGAGNALGAGHLGSDSSPFSDTSIKNDDEAAKPLLATTAGGLGDFAGGTVASIPLGGAGGGVAKLAGRVLPSAVKALATLGTQGGRLARAGGAVARALPGAAVNAGEGAAYSAATGDVDKQGDAAESGAGISAALGGAGKMFTRALKGGVEKSADAKLLINEAAREGKDLFIPIAQGAKDTGLSGSLKTGYKEVLPYALGTEVQMGRQSAKAEKDITDTLFTGRGSPDQVDSAGRLVRSAPNIGNTNQQTAANLKDVYDKGYQNTIKSYAFNKPQNFIKDVTDNLANHSELGDSEKQHIATTLDEILQRKIDPNGSISGAGLTDAMKKGRTALSKMEDEVGNPASTNSAMNAFHDVVQDAINDHKNMLPTLTGNNKAAAQQTITDLENYHKLNDSYGEARALMATTGKNRPGRGEVNWRTLVNEAPEGSPTENIGQSAFKVFGEDPGVTPSGRHLLHTAGGGAGITLAGYLGHLPAAIATNLGGNALATKTVQKALYGDLASQQALTRVMKNNPQLTHSLSLAAREAGIDGTR